MYTFEHNNCKIHWRDTKFNFNFRTNFNETEMASQALNYLSFKASIWKHLYDFIKRVILARFVSRRGEWKNAFQTTCGSYFETKWLNSEDNLCRMTIHEKKKKKKKNVSKLSTAIKLYVNVSWETTLLPLWREELNKLFFFVNVNAYSNISVSKPAPFDTISTKISQFCSFAKHC